MELREEYEGGVRKNTGRIQMMVSIRFFTKAYEISLW